MNVRSIGYAARMIRQAKGLSQCDVARNSRLTRQHISKLERGVQKATIFTVRKLAKGVQVEPSVLVAMAETRRAA